ncbi:segregation and condensation protein A [Bacillus chungangensis]|uniref:Segregation and condensation protein A n=2 Tax=Bacillus chungangensis TaxID=587633 RepID=A0ABT9WXL3_9BACI|nr:segregation and condensation protein A [Bacillus chungangensis]
MIQEMVMILEYNVKIDVFEGPLDLLLHLINRFEIDIYDIPMAQITEQYFIYIHTMKELQLDVASEYLVMAATLLAIKSSMLLPKNEEAVLDEDIDLEPIDDPREELVERLMEYRKYKEAAKQLKEREEERQQIYTKPSSDLSEYTSELAPAKLDVTIHDMLGAFHKLLRRKQLQKPLTTKVARQEISIEEKMADILTDLKRNRKRKSFFSFFPHFEKEQIVVTFLAILELMKRNEIIVEQENNFTDFYLSLAGDEQDVQE